MVLDFSSKDTPELKKMYRDVWEAIVLFLEPIDLICSVSKVSREWNEIANRCGVKFTHYDDCWEMCENYMSHQLTFQSDFLVMKAQKFFIKYYLRQLAFKLSSHLTFNGRHMNFSENEISHDMELFKCYHSMYHSKKITVPTENQSNSDYSSILSYVLSFFVTTLKKTEEKKESSCHILKNVLIGEFRTGKSTFFKTFDRHYFSQYRGSSFDFVNKTCALLGKEYNIQLWDLCGAERFYEANNIPRMYIRETDVFIVCFSVQHRGSFECVKSKWFNMKRDEEQSQMVLLGLLGNIRKIQDDKCLTRKLLRWHLKRINPFIWKLAAAK